MLLYIKDSKIQLCGRIYEAPGSPSYVAGQKAGVLAKASSLSTDEEFGTTGERARGTWSVTFLPGAALLFEMSPTNPTLEQMTPNQTFNMSTYYVPGGLCASL